MLCNQSNETDSNRKPGNAIHGLKDWLSRRAYCSWDMLVKCQAFDEVRFLKFILSGQLVWADARHRSHTLKQSLDKTKTNIPQITQIFQGGIPTFQRPFSQPQPHQMYGLSQIQRQNTILKVLSFQGRPQRRMFPKQNVITVLGSDCTCSSVEIREVACVLSSRLWSWNRSPWGLKQNNLDVWLPPVYHVKSLLGGYREWKNKTCHEFN